MFKALALLVWIAAAATATPSPAPMPTPQSLPVIVVRAPKAALHLQVATTSSQRERGLMGVTRLQPHNGMLFVFDSDATVGFWMKNTLISLDMVFVGADGIIRHVYSRVPVVSATIPDADIPVEQGAAKYVIELPAGEALTDGLRDGVHVRDLPQ